MTGESGLHELLEQLPRQLLSAGARAELDRAGCAGAAALRAAVRAAVGELLGRGELVRVAVDGRPGVRGPLFLVRGTSRLLDLSALGAGDNGRDRPQPAPGPLPVHQAAPQNVPPADRNRQTPPAGDGSAVPTARAAAATARGPAVLDVDGVLGAMERAQDLAVGDPRAEDPAVMVSRILSLLAGYLPDVQLHVQLGAEVDSGAADPHVLPPIPGLDAPFWLRCRSLGQAIWIPDTTELPDVLRRRLAATPEVATAVVPLWSPGDAGHEVGLLFVSAAGRERDQLLVLAHRLSTFVTRRWRCQRDVNRRVLTDSLTGIRNRAFFDSQFPLELERARRGNFPLTLAIGDLDHFKTINDTYHHQCGDAVLRSVAHQLQDALRRIDYVCRIGGEEFALILPYTSQREARDVLGRLAGRPLTVVVPPEYGAATVTVTMSYGAVTFPDAGNSAGELHRKADSMLYRAKELGRNRCCFWIAPGRHQLLMPHRARAADH